MCTLGWEVGRSVHTEIDPTSPIMGVKTKWNPDLEASGIKRYTGSGLKKTDPERYDSVLKAAKKGFGPETLTEVFGISPQLAAEIVQQAERDPKAQEAFLSDLIKTRDAALEKLSAAIESGELKPDKLPVTVGILIDKVETMMGKPSTTIRHETINLSDSALRELIASCKPAKVVDAEVIEEKS
jgi:hypothetical protein